MGEARCGRWLMKRSICGNIHSRLNLRGYGVECTFTDCIVSAVRFRPCPQKGDTLVLFCASPSLSINLSTPSLSCPPHRCNWK